MGKNSQYPPVGRFFGAEGRLNWSEIVKFTSTPASKIKVTEIADIRSALPADTALHFYVKKSTRKIMTMEN